MKKLENWIKATRQRAVTARNKEPRGTGPNIMLSGKVKAYTDVLVQIENLNNVKVANCFAEISMPAKKKQPSKSYQIDAEFIVTACNNFEDLREACQIALQRLQDLRAEDDDEALGKCPACQKLRDVLARTRTDRTEKGNV